MNEKLAVQVEKLEMMIEAGDLSGALDFLESLSQEERGQWQIQNLTGVVCAYCGQFQEAEDFFQAALAQRPEDENIQYNLADVRETLRKQAENGSGKPAAEAGRRVLMAAYYFPPLSGSGVFRSIKFAKYLPLYGWQPTVISTDRPPNGWNFADESQVAEIPQGMEVVRVPDGISTGRETSLNSARVQAILEFLRGVLRFSPEADRIFSKVCQTHAGIMQMLTFPCAALSWAYDVVQYIEKNIDLKRYDAIYTTSGPSSAHLIGFYLKQKYGIPWVADYRDPWTFNPYGAAYDPNKAGQRLLFELESVLLRGADCNLTVEDSLIAVYEKQFGLGREKIVSITNGYDEEDFAALRHSQNRTDKFTINYSGLLYTRQRSVDPVLRAIRQLRIEKKIDLSKLRFRIVGTSEPGNIEAAERYGLAQIMDHTGYLSHSQALQANVDADLLLLLVGDEPRFKPVYTGKFFEYLRSGRPILALAPKDGVVDRVLRESGHGEAYLSTQTSKIKAAILREYKKWENGERSELLHSPVIERFERRELTRHLAEVLESTVAKSASLPGTGSGGLAGQTTQFPVHKKDDRTDLESLAETFLYKNYNYVWLKAMMYRASNVVNTGAALITGSSYGVNGVIERSWNQAVNCSVSSQDLYYDFLCAKNVMINRTAGRFSKCFIIDGYYAACHDLSSGKQERELMIPNVYYPIFADGHHWDEAYQNELWSGLGSLTDDIKRSCEQLAVEKVLRQGTYFSEKKLRGGTVFNLNGRNWWDVPPDERSYLGKIRADCHNKLFQHKESIAENKIILKEYVHFLQTNGVTPIFVVAPFTHEYSQYILREMKESIHELISGVAEEILYMDFNQLSCFEPNDFVDTDHLSQRGAEKFSKLLTEMYGK